VTVVTSDAKAYQSSSWWTGFENRTERDAKVWWKITAEIPLAAVCFICGLNFWAVIKCSLYRHRMLTDAQLLDRFLQCVGHDWIIRAGALVRPQTASHGASVLQLSRKNAHVLWAAGNLFLLAVLVLSAGSYFLQRYFLVIDAAIFFLAAVPPRTRAMTNYILSDIYLVVLHLYKWNMDLPQNCSAEIAGRIPHLRKTLDAVQRMNKAGATPAGSATRTSLFGPRD
jgi:hypothetical protein